VAPSLGRFRRGSLATFAGESTASVVGWMCSSELIRFLRGSLGVGVAAVVACPAARAANPSGRAARLHRLPVGRWGYRAGLQELV